MELPSLLLPPLPPPDDLLLAALLPLLLAPRRDTAEELAVDLAELAVEAATGGIPLAEEAGRGCRGGGG